MKPEVLYHGSPNIDIEILEPREESPGHKLSGKYVFATQHRELAAMFLAPKVAPMQMSRYGKEYILIAQCTEQEYKEGDTGGAIYELPGNSFKQGDTDMPDVEWYSDKPVHSNNKEVYSYSFEAMRQCGVKVYFVDSTTYEAIQNADDHGLEILQRLLPSD